MALVTGAFSPHTATTADNDSPRRPQRSQSRLGRRHAAGSRSGRRGAACV